MKFYNSISFLIFFIFKLFDSNYLQVDKPNTILVGIIKYGNLKQIHLSNLQKAKNYLKNYEIELGFVINFFHFLSSNFI